MDGKFRLPGRHFRKRTGDRLEMKGADPDDGEGSQDDFGLFEGQVGLKTFPEERDQDFLQRFRMLFEPDD